MAPAGNDEEVNLRAATSELEASLLEEASEVKQCFNDYAFKALTFSSAVLAAVAAYQSEQRLVGLATVPVISLLLVVARIGTHKYGTANRIYGYLLYLDKLRHSRRKLREPDSQARPPALREVHRRQFMLTLGWQEAMRAWRVVQATVFERIYQSGRWSLNIQRAPFRNERQKWFEPPTLVKRGTAWHSGGFLGNVLFVLHLFSVIALVPLIALCVQEWHTAAPLFAHAFGWFVGLTVLGSLAVLYRVLKTRARRDLLENGLLSINSCALMWQAVAVAYYRTDQVMTGRGMVDSSDGYIRLLSSFARDLSKHLRKKPFHRWLSADEDGACIARIEEDEPERRLRIAS
jgi:hypothetical protein